MHMYVYVIIYVYIGVCRRVDCGCRKYAYTSDNTHACSIYMSILNVVIGGYVCLCVYIYISI